ncbi:MAG: aminodeoxychorismate lyase [Gammaproteobacteria bacterium]|nr:aminodeoxychorismate lyase [Gammaproteobacteria bacterium]
MKWCIHKEDSDITNFTFLNERGFAYGDGVFETIRVVNGKLPLWSLHWQRLQQSLIRLKIEALNEQAILDQINALTSKQGEYKIKIIVTRSNNIDPSKTYTPDNHAAQCYIGVAPLNSSKIKNNTRKLVQLNTQLAKQPLLAGLKHLNRLEQVMASIELSTQSADEGIVCDTDNFIIECTRHNIFWVSDNCLYTPDLGFAGVAGVMRQWILEQASSLNISYRIARYPADALKTADEVFISNAIHGIVAVSSIDSRLYSQTAISQKLQERAQQQLGF